MVLSIVYGTVQEKCAGPRLLPKLLSWQNRQSTRLQKSVSEQKNDCAKGFFICCKTAGGLSAPLSHIFCIKFLFVLPIPFTLPKKTAFSNALLHYRLCRQPRALQACTAVFFPFFPCTQKSAPDGMTFRLKRLMLYLSKF